MTPRVLAIAAVVVGVAAAIAGSPYAAHPVTATELAGWIRDRTPGLHVIDVRPAAEFASYQIPTAENIPIDAIERIHFPVSDTLVLYAGDGAHDAEARVSLRALGYHHVFFLRGDLDAWIDEIMSPEHSTDLTRYFGGVARPAGSPRAVAPAGSATERAARLRRGCG